MEGNHKGSHSAPRRGGGGWDAGLGPLWPPAVMVERMWSWDPGGVRHSRGFT